MSHRMLQCLGILICFTITGCDTTSSDPVLSTDLQETAIITDNQSANLVATHTPISPEILPLSTTLPLDQIWVLVGGRLFAVGTNGQLTPLEGFVQAYVERADNPPLLLIRTKTGTYELADPLDWQRIVLDIPQGWSIQIYLALSSDQKQVAFTAQDTNTWQIHMVNLQDKTQQVLVDHTTPLDPPIDFIADPAYPIRWHGDNLFLHAQASADSLIWRINLSDVEALIHNVHHVTGIGNYGLSEDTSILAFARDTRMEDDVISEMVISHLPTNTEKLVDQSVGHDVYNVTLSPDAARLVYAEVVLPNATHYDVWLHNSVTQQIIKLNRLKNRPTVSWSSDSKRLIVITQHDIFLYDQDGELIGQLPKSIQTKGLKVVNDQLLILVGEEHLVLQWHSFREKDTPLHSDTALPLLQDGHTEIIYVP